ncbi:MAG: hypothetical protein F6J92_01690 [Symploca sp. SIO1A3]|nr:hypothetical protein [Symploca sp. SIO1A3]
MVVDCKSHSLLIVSCSQRKHNNPGLMRAIERYDGPAFLVTRRFLRQKTTGLLDIYILSAEFGLISSEQTIPNYDRRMTQQQAQQLQPRVIAELEKILNKKPYQQLLICVSRDYLQALNGYEQLIPKELTVQVTRGALGKKLSQLYQWLYGEPATPCSSTSEISQGRACLRGVELVLTPEQVLEKARCGMVEGKDEFKRYQSWYVPIDDQKVASKWLVSQLTGLPVKTFTASEARRVLRQLGIEVIQIEDDRVVRSELK